MDGVETGVRFDCIGQIAITVTDLPRAKSFYQNVLGMKFLFDAANMAFFQCGEIRLMIGFSEKPVQPGGTILYFRVAEIHQAYEALLARQVIFLQKPQLVAKMPDHELWMAFLKDPDGNVLGMMCEVASAARAEGPA
ncbi:MAG TPA: VOC family protein [Terracidiphilus sp.]|nr:VOC family protein [Terracidiphilus sp.]